MESSDVRRSIRAIEELSKALVEVQSVMLKGLSTVAEISSNMNRLAGQIKDIEDGEEAKESEEEIT